MKKIMEKLLFGTQSKDEYQEKIYTQYIAEAGFLVMIINFIYMITKTIYYKEITIDIIICLSLFLIFSGYLTIKIFFNKIDSINIYSKKELKKYNKQLIKISTIQGIIFLIIFSILSYFIDNEITWSTNILVSIFFGIAMYFGNKINAKNSLKINNELND
jgi:hypothetical protein